MSLRMEIEEKFSELGHKLLPHAEVRLDPTTHEKVIRVVNPAPPKREAPNWINDNVLEVRGRTSDETVANALKQRGFSQPHVLPEDR